MEKNLKLEDSLGKKKEDKFIRSRRLYKFNSNLKKGFARTKLRGEKTETINMDHK